MATALKYDEDQELEKTTFHQRLLLSLERTEASYNTVAAAIELAQDTKVARRTIVFPAAEDNSAPARMPPEGLGQAIELYLQRIFEMETLRRQSSGRVLSQAVSSAFKELVRAADVLEGLGWPVNYEQSLQAIMEPTDFGISNGELVDRYRALPETVTLGQRLALLGGVTFYIQKRGADGKLKGVRREFLIGRNKFKFEQLEMHLNNGEGGLSKQFLYRSDWITNEMLDTSSMVFV